MAVITWYRSTDFWEYPGSSVGKESVCSPDLLSIPGLRRPPGEENGNPFQYSCLENPMDRGAWLATVQGVASLDLATKPPHHAIPLYSGEEATIKILYEPQGFC